MSFEFTVDPMDDFDDTLIKDAYIQIRFTRAVRLRGGQFKLPGSREYGTSARSLDFLERSAFRAINCARARHRRDGVRGARQAVRL